MYSSQIRTFTAVAECGSFSKASKKLFVTTVSVMKQINAFEDHIGVKLFVRTNHGVRLTEAGEEVYETAKEIIALSDKTVKKLQADNKAKEIVIRIGTSILYPVTPLVDLLAKASDTDIHVKIRIVPMGEGFANLNHLAGELGKTVDCFVAGYDSNHILETCGIYPLSENPCRISVPKNHRLANKKLIEWHDLKGENLMLLKKGHSPVIDKIRKEIETAHKEINIIDVPDFYNAEVFNECVSRGYLLGTPSIWGNIHPSLISVPVEWDYKLKLGIIYSKKPDKAVKLFLKEIEKAAVN